MSNELKEFGMKLLALFGFIAFFLFGCGVIAAITEHGLVLYIIWLIVSAKLFKGLMNK